MAPRKQLAHPVQSLSSLHTGSDACTGLVSGLLESERRHRQSTIHQIAELRQLQQQV